jgi:hypothetical protein
MSRPTSAPRSSRSTTGSSGFFERRMNCHQEASPRTLFDSTIAVRNENVSSATATTRIPIATPAASISCGWRIFSMPSKIAKAPPRLNRTMATMKAQK